MTRSADEPFTLYGLIAKSIETNAARDKVVFHLDPAARFSDGTPITSADVVFTFNLLKAKGRPQQRAAFSLVKSHRRARRLDRGYDLSGANDRELPLTLAIMPVLSRAHTDAEHFEDQTLQIPVGSGPYRVAEVKPGSAWCSSATPTTGRRICRSRAASTISIGFASTTIATRRRCSKPSRPG